MKNNERSNSVKLEQILHSGMPLEMEAYYILSKLHSNNKIRIDWIQPDYSFLTTNENWQIIERSIDLVSSMPIFIGFPLPSIQLYFAIECKWVSPKDRIWVFMPDIWIQEDYIFGGHRPSLFQDAKLYGKAKTKFGDNKKIPLCAKGLPLSLKNSKNKNKPDIGFNTGLHQLRDATHHLMIERFRLFIKTFDPASGICIIPILYTNAEMRILKVDKLNMLDLEEKSKSISFSEITKRSNILLYRTPRNDVTNEKKWGRFKNAYGKYPLKEFENALPEYKKERTVYTHLMNFFRITPTYINIVKQGYLEKYLLDQIEWVKSILTNNG